MSEPTNILVVGASGYVGGRLVDKLLTEGIAPVLAGRDTSALASRWPGLEVRPLDLGEPDGLGPALRGIDTAVYLARQWDGTAVVARRDLERVRAFHAAAERAGVRHVIHLTRLWDPWSAADDRVGATPGLSITELRSGLIVGSGSAGFEVLRYLVERQPVLLAPRWMRTSFEPVSTGDIGTILVAALRRPQVTGRVELGCGEPVTFEELALRYGRERRLSRPVLRFPLTAPRASAAWIHALSPVPGDLALPLVRGLGRDHLVGDGRPAARLGVVTRRVDEMLRRAIDRRDTAATTWFDAVRRPRTPLANASTIEGMQRDRRELVVDAPPEAVFAAVTRVGGSAGWPNAELLWRLRGLMDRAVGGPGMRRGRRDPIDLRVGDVLDFWRVEACEAPVVLRLNAEMKVPGRAWLEFAISDAGAGRSHLVQTAYYEPHGVFGLLYWWAMLPFHAFVFRGMLRELARRAQGLAAVGSPGRGPSPTSDP